MLQILDKIRPGLVVWSKVKQTPLNRFEKVINCDYAVALGKQLGFSLVGISGGDFVDRKSKLILALVWQSCKFHLFSILRTGGNTNVDERLILDWANKTVMEAGAKKSIKSFKDPSIASGLFLINLIDAIHPGVINYDMVSPGSKDEERMLNAKYILGVARKIGCFCFQVWEDIVEVKPNMILALIATLRLHK